MGKVSFQVIYLDMTDDKQIQFFAFKDLKEAPYTLEEGGTELLEVIMPEILR